MKKNLYLAMLLLACLSCPKPAQGLSTEIGGGTTPPPKPGGPTIVATQDYNFQN